MTEMGVCKSCDVELDIFLAGLVTTGRSVTELAIPPDISKHEQANRLCPPHHIRVGSTGPTQITNMIQRWNVENLHSAAIAYL